MSTGKQSWEKPLLRTINLVGEEVLAGGCKLPGPGAGPLGGACYLSNSAKCVNPGS